MNSSTGALFRLTSWRNDGEPIAMPEGHSDWVPGALELDDGRLLSWSKDSTLRLWNGEGEPLDVWATPFGVISSVVASATSPNGFAAVVNRITCWWWRSHADPQPDFRNRTTVLGFCSREVVIGISAPMPFAWRSTRARVATSSFGSGAPARCATGWTG